MNILFQINLVIFHQTQMHKKPQPRLREKKIFLTSRQRKRKTHTLHRDTSCTKKRYYNKSWFFFYLILYVYENSLTSGGENKNENALDSQVTLFFFCNVSVFVASFYFTEKTRFSLYSNVIEPLILQNIYRNVRNEQNTFVLRKRTEHQFWRSNLTHIIKYIVLCSQLYLYILSLMIIILCYSITCNEYGKK